MHARLVVWLLFAAASAGNSNDWRPEHVHGLYSAQFKEFCGAIPEEVAGLYDAFVYAEQWIN